MDVRRLSLNLTVHCCTTEDFFFYENIDQALIIDHYNKV
jgi:hypothetical protein